VVDERAVEHVTLVAGVDSSTQSCKVVIWDAETGTAVRHGRAPHPEGTEVHPDAWWRALRTALDEAGGLTDVAAVAVGAQQHGMVCLDEAGRVVRPALLWNDTRSADAAVDLISELGGGAAGRRAWADAVGVVPVASFTVTKLRWLAQHEPAAACRTAAVCLPHDWLTWRLGTDPSLEGLRTDRGDASGTGYWSAVSDAYRGDLLARALGHDAAVPRVLGPSEPAGTVAGGPLLGPGTGDNAAAALGLDTRPGDVVVSIGTSGVVCSVTDTPTTDPSGTVAGFADATGRFLPLVATLNAARVLDAIATMLRVDHEELSRLALSAPPGADGLVIVPYLEGERTPDRPDATGAVHGLRAVTATAAHLARAAVEGLLCGLADGIDALVAAGARVERVFLVGGGARSSAVRRIAPTVLGRPVLVPPPGEYVADGAARQAAWALSGDPEPPPWTRAGVETYESDVVEAVRVRYAEARELTVARQRPEGRPC
jgi:xylulokinase